MSRNVARDDIPFMTAMETASAIKAGEVSPSEAVQT